MNVYIPVIGILWFLLIWAIIGLLLFVPFVYWQHRFISNYKTFSAWQGVKIFRGLATSALVWPVMLFFSIKTEIEYRRKGYL